jgi:hypothetical protein
MTTEGDETAAIMAELPGGQELIAWFGYVPRFHNAELLDLHLGASGASLRLHTWRMTSETDEKGYYLLDKHVVVTFSLERLTGITLEGHDSRGILYGLNLRRYGSGDPLLSTEVITMGLPPEPDDLGLQLDHTYGLWGVMYARKISLSLTPGKPSKS